MLLERLHELGGLVLRPRVLADVRQDDAGVVATLDDGTQVRARYVVGADGMHSTVREGAGIGFTGGSYGESFVLADVRDGRRSGPAEVSSPSARGLVVVAPLAGRPHRIVATVDDAPATPDLDYVQRLLDARGPARPWSPRGLVLALPGPPPAGRPLPRRPCALAGDAAHVHSPAGGQGMNIGIQDGYALGRAFATGELDGYEARRRPVAQRVVAFTDRMTRMATSRNPVVRRVRNIALPLLGHTAVPRKLATELAELNYR